MGQSPESVAVEDTRGPRQIMELWEILKWGSQQGLCAARTGLAAELGRPLTSV